MDRRLVERAQDGDREAFAVLAEAVADRLYAVASRMLRRDDRAQDVVQQALVAAWRELPSLRDPERFEAWMHRIAARLCLAEARRMRKLEGRVRALDLDLPADGDPYRGVADRDELERAFARLVPDHRLILVLHHYLELSSNEIGHVLDVPAGTVRSRLHYAHRQLRAVLEADARTVLTAERPT